MAKPTPDELTEFVSHVAAKYGDDVAQQTALEMLEHDTCDKTGYPWRKIGWLKARRIHHRNGAAFKRLIVNDESRYLVAPTNDGPETSVYAGELYNIPEIRRLIRLIESGKTDRSTVSMISQARRKLKKLKNKLGIEMPVTSPTYKECERIFNCTCSRTILKTKKRRYKLL